jgi:hypothetical protein
MIILRHLTKITYGSLDVGNVDLCSVVPAESLDDLLPRYGCCCCCTLHGESTSLAPCVGLKIIGKDDRDVQ